MAVKLHWEVQQGKGGVVDLVFNKEFCVQEDDLYNEKNYRIQDKKFKVSGKTNKLLNCTIKHRSKRKESREGRS